jgi:hypothetical protein
MVAEAHWRSGTVDLSCVCVEAVAFVISERRISHATRPFCFQQSIPPRQAMAAPSKEAIQKNENLNVFVKIKGVS